jgi:hypothetical protein
MSDYQRYNISGFLAEGKKVEIEFSKLLPNPIFATPEEDKKEHWDVKDGGIRYDVKGMKKINRIHSEPSQHFHWVELKNVMGDHGWLYGQADYIVFEISFHWVVVKRSKLVNFIDRRVDFSMEINNKPYQIKKYELYQRANRSDLMVLVDIIDLISISERMILKKHLDGNTLGY